MDVDHIQPKSKGGKDTLDNLQLLHKCCHDLKTANDGSLVKGCTHDKGYPTGKPYEGKLSCTVLKTSSCSDTIA
jgi:RNA-directed DNA polymerase